MSHHIFKVLKHCADGGSSLAFGKKKDSAEALPICYC